MLLEISAGEIEAKGQREAGMSSEPMKSMHSGKVIEELTGRRLRLRAGLLLICLIQVWASHHVPE